MHKIKDVDLTKYEQVNNTENYVVFLEKNPISPSIRQMVVIYKKRNVAMQCTVNNSLLMLFMGKGKQK